MRRLAFLIGISDYRYVSSLSTPGNDVKAVGDMLSLKYNYQVYKCLDPNKKKLGDYFSKGIPAVMLQEPEETQVLIYFAGHGVAENSEEGIKGYLIPVDGKPGESRTWYAMEDMLTALNTLENRHLLLVLDCCFGGVIRWASKIRGIGHRPEKRLSKQHYDYFTKKASWQVLTSTAPNQSALDLLGHDEVNGHSPFAGLFLNGLSGRADLMPDKVITISELFVYLQHHLSEIIKGRHKQQNAGLFPLERHDNGDFLFFMKGFDPGSLQPVKSENPYKGLDIYSCDDITVFFGRDKAREELFEKIEKHKFTVVVGASGTGKSSLVQAGVVPRLLLSGSVKTIQPGKNPLKELDGIEHIDILVVDQFEQLVTQSDKQEVPFFWEKLVHFIASGKKIIITLRIDFEQQLNIPPDLVQAWQLGRYMVPPFTAEELREIIITPAYRVGRFIEPLSLVDEIIEEVIHYPGSLPLLSFTMQQLFEKCKDDLYGYITKEDYDNMGGVTGTLQFAADKVYQELEPASQETMRNLMLRMVSFRGGETAGRRVMECELEFNEAAENSRIKTVLDKLSEERLIRYNRDQDGLPFIAPSHDALVKTWSKMQDWIKECTTEKILLHTALNEATHRYIEKVKRKDPRYKEYLWSTDPRLDVLKKERDQEDALQLRLNRWELSFLKKSEEEHENILEQEMKLRKEAEEQRDRAIRALSNSMVNASKQAITDDNPGKSFRLAEYAWELDSDNNDAIDQMLLVYWKLPTLEFSPLIPYPLFNSPLHISEDGKRFCIIYASGIIQVWDWKGNLLHAIVGFKEEPNIIKFSAELKFFLVSTKEGNTQVIDIENNFYFLLNKSFRNICDAFFSSDYQTVILTSKEGDVGIWNYKEDVFSSIYKNQNNYKFWFSPCRQFFISYLRNDQGESKLELLNVSGDLIKELVGYGGLISDIVYSHDCKKFLLFDINENKIKLYDQLGCLIFKCFYSDSVSSYRLKHPILLFTTKDTRIVVGFKSTNLPVQVRNDKGKLLHTLDFAGTCLKNIHVAPNSKWIITESDVIELWDDRGYQLSEMKSTGEDLLNIIISPDSERIITIWWGGKTNNDIIELWDNKGNSIKRIKERSRFGCEIKISPNSKNIIFLKDNIPFHLLDRDGNELIPEYHFEDEEIGNVGEFKGFSPSGDYFLTVFEGSINDTKSRVKVWNINAMSDDFDYEEYLFSNNINEPYIGFTPVGDKIIVSNISGEIQLFPIGKLPGLGDLNVLGEFRVNYDNILCASKTFNGTKGYSSLTANVNDNGDRLVVEGGHENKVLLSSLKRDEIEEIYICKEKVYDAVFSPDNKKILINTEKKVEVLIEKNGVYSSEFKIDEIPVSFDIEDIHSTMNSRSIFSPNGKIILTILAHDNNAKLWDVKGKFITSISGHKKDICFASFSFDNEKLLTASEDRTAKLWKVNGELLHTFSGHKEKVNSAVFSPDNTKILTTSEDRTAKLWDVEGNLLKTIYSNSGPFIYADFSSDGTKYVTTSLFIDIWNLEGKHLHNLRLPAPPEELGAGAPGIALFSNKNNQVFCHNFFGPINFVWDLNIERLIKEVNQRGISTLRPKEFEEIKMKEIDESAQIDRISILKNRGTPQEILNITTYYLDHDNRNETLMSKDFYILSSKVIEKNLFNWINHLWKIVFPEVIPKLEDHLSKN